MSESQISNSEVDESKQLMQNQNMEYIENEDQDQNNSRFLQQSKSIHSKQEKFEGQIKQQIGKEGKNKKLDIKRLIQQKQARQNKQKGGQQKFTIGIEQHFSKTQHKSIQKCVYCGFVLFILQQKQRQDSKLTHLKRQHPQIPLAVAKYYNTQESDEGFRKIAEELIKFATNIQNKQAMQYITGQRKPQLFKSYVEHLPIRKDLEKWKKITERIFNVHDN